MADTSPKKKVAAKPKKPAAHPKYSEMVGSRQAILKYIMAKFNVGKDAKTVNIHLKLSLRAGVKNKGLKQSKGTGASGSFKIGEVDKPKKKPAAIPKAAKPKKAKTPKKTAAKKPAAEKKAAKPKAKKPAAAKNLAAKPAKKATKSPKKTKAVKPKKTPKKK